MAVNSRLGIPVNLPQGATYDILVLSHADGYPEGKIDFKFYDTPRKITGVQKVTQTFVRILFTGKGSDVLNPNFGTAFSDLTLNANRTGVDRDLYISISNAVRDAEKQTIAVSNTVTADESSQLDKVTILGIDTSNESIIMYLKIQTVAGELAQISIPFPELDMTLSQE